MCNLIAQFKQYDVHFDISFRTRSNESSKGMNMSRIPSSKTTFNHNFGCSKLMIHIIYEKLMIYKYTVIYINHMI